MLSAASARSPKGLLHVTLLALAAGALVAPALAARDSSPHEPPAPSDLAVAESTTTSLTLRWAPDEQAESFTVYAGERLAGTTDSPQFTLRALDCGRGYELGVEAADEQGRRSALATVIAPTAPCPERQTTQPPPTLPPAPPGEPAAPAASTSTAPAPADEPAQPPKPVAPEQSTPAPPPTVWQTAGVFVWHEAAVDPETLGRELKENGFGWAAVQLHDGLAVDEVQDDWIQRFRAASGGLPVGGWGVLRTDPVAEAQLAQSLLARYGLDFYIADAESEYKYSSDAGSSDVRYARSREFVDAFRAGMPDLPAAVSSYCRADREDIDWESWAGGGFDFLPQAYVNDLGDYVTPAECTDGASKWFPASAVHPTIGMYASRDPATPDAYTRLLAAAHTVGFSVYLAETQKDPQAWSVLGDAIGTLGIAREGGANTPDPATSPAPERPDGAG